MDIQPFVEEDGKRIVSLPSSSRLLLLLLLLAFLAPPTPRSHFLFARQINPPRRGVQTRTSLSGLPRDARSFLRLFFPPLDFSGPLALRSSIEAPFDRFLETKTSVKTTKEVSSTVVTALVDIASIVLICCFQSRPSWASFI